MYQEHSAYLEFLARRGIIINSEDRYQHIITDPVLSEQIPWSEINEVYRQNHLVVVDDFLAPEVAARLRDFVLYRNLKEDFYDDYAAINFYPDNRNGAWFPLLTNIVDGIIQCFQPGHPLFFQRAWTFIYHNHSNGVTAHADPAAINFNLWVTPDQCLVPGSGSNGFDIWKVMPPDHWTWQQYNRDVGLIETFLDQYQQQKISIEYRFNRMVIFDSKFFHKGQPVQARDGYENRRINYTFLFD